MIRWKANNACLHLLSGFNNNSDVHNKNAITTMKVVLLHSILLCATVMFWCLVSTTAFAQSLSVVIENNDSTGSNTLSLDKAALANARQSLSIVALSKEKPADRTERAIKSAHRQAEKEIRKALQPFGFYSPEIIATLEKTDSASSDNWQATYTINSGPQTKLGAVDITISGPGKTDPQLQQRLAENPLQTGNPLNHSLYNNYKQNLFDTLYESGYLDARYRKSEIRVAISKAQADIVLELDTGAQYFFGDVTIIQDIIRPKLIERFITVDRDTPFNTNRLLDLQLQLVDSGYFSVIDIDVQKEQAVEQRIPVVITATPAKKLKYSTSVGYGTDTGPRVGLSVLNRRVNNRGHHFQYSVRLSEVESNLTAQYTIPVGDIKSEYVDVFASGNRENVNDVEATQYSVGVGLHQNRWGGRRTLSLKLAREDFSFDDSNEQSSTLLIPGIRYFRKKADATLFSRRGYSVSVDLHGGLESALSETSFLHGYVNFRSVLPLGNRGRLLNRFELGAISVDDFNELPPSERFFTGGAQSVRGYGYKDIGARDAQGNNIGGQYLATMSAEMDYLVSGNYGFAVFVDAGDAADSRTLDLKTAAGLGFRYRSPIGMIRVDLAHPFDNPDDDVRLHFSLGPDL